MSFESAIVTGASGFIGRALAAHLAMLGKYVIVAGRPGSSTLPAAQRELRIAFPSREALAAGLGGERVDVVFHCASYGTVPHQRDRAEMFDANVADVSAWVEAAAGVDARAFVYVGSCSEYGCAPENIPIGENVPLAATDLYGASKAVGGQWGRAVAREVGIGFQWVRMFGVYGAGEAQHRLLPYLHAKLIKGERVDLTPGRQRRDFLHVDDAVRGLVLAAEAALSGRMGPFNLCSGKAVTVHTFAETVATLISDSAIDLLDFGAREYGPDEQLWMVGDPSKFIASTGFHPEIDFRNGICRVLRDLESSGTDLV